MMSYVYGAIAAAFLGLAAACYFFYTQSVTARAETVQVRADLDTAIKVNKQNQSIITALRTGFKIANDLAADLAGEVETITTEADALRDEITALREADNEVDAYLGGDVPASLKKLYAGSGGDRAK